MPEVPGAALARPRRPAQLWPLRPSLAARADAVTLVNATKRRANRPHRCMYCSRTIERGELYQRQFSADGGDVWTWKECAQCTAFARYLWEQHRDEHYGPDDADCYEPGTRGGAVVKNRWRRCWRNKRTGELYPADDIKRLLEKG